MPARLADPYCRSTSTRAPLKRRGRKTRLLRRLHAQSLHALCVLNIVDRVRSRMAAQRRLDTDPAKTSMAAAQSACRRRLDSAVLRTHEYSAAKGIFAAQLPLVEEFNHGRAYSAHNRPAPAALAHHVSGAAAHLAARQAPATVQAVGAQVFPCAVRFTDPVGETRREGYVFVGAAEGAGHELVAVLEQVGAELTTGEGEVV